MKNFFIRLSQRLSAFPAFLFVFLLGIAAMAIVGFLRLQFEEDISTLFPVEQDGRNLMEVVEQSNLSDRMVVLLEHKGDESPEDRAEMLIGICDSMVQYLHSELDSTVLSGIFYQVDEANFLPLVDMISDRLPIFLEPSDYDRIAERIDTNEIEPRIKGLYKTLLSPAGFALRRTAFKDPFQFGTLALEKLKTFQVEDNFELYNGYLVSKDRRNLVFTLTPSLSGRETLANKAMLASLEEAMTIPHKVGLPTISGYYFGAIAVAVGNADQIRIDVTLTVGIALLVLFFFVARHFNNWRIFFFLTLPVLCGAICALFITSLIDNTVSLIALGIGSVLLGIAIDYAIHFYSHYRHENDTEKALKDVSSPVMASSLTTAVAFACLMVLRSEAIRDLGLFAALSLLLIGTFTLVLLPQLARRFDPKVSSSGKKTMIDRLGEYPIEKKWWAHVIWIGLTLFAIIQWQTPQFETDLNQINYMSTDLKQAEQKLNAVTSATQRGVYLVSSGSSLNEALEKHREVYPMCKTLLGDGIISQYNDLQALLPPISVQEERLQRWRSFWTPDRINQLEKKVKNAVAQTQLKTEVFEPFFSNLKRTQVPVSPDTLLKKSGGLLTDFIHTGQEQVAVLTLMRLDQSNKPKIYNAFSEVDGVSIMDKEYLMQRLVELLKEDFNILLWVSLGLVIFILNIYFGRIETTIIAMVPIGLSWFWTLSLMPVFGLDFNIVNIILITFIFGLGIDFAIFIMQGVLHEFRYKERILPSFKSAILLSLLTTTAGIGALIFAKHPALQSIAGVSLIGIPLVALAAFSIEPLMARYLLYKKGGYRMFSLNVVNMTATLYIYFLLVVGCILLSIVALVLELLIFIPRKYRSFGLHYLIYHFSRFYIWTAFAGNRTVLNPTGETFEKPALIISNHQSLIDTPIIFSLSPKLLIMTNNWVYRNPLFHVVCRLADFFPKNIGLENLVPALRKQIEQGYNVSLFPEGSRSPDETVKRFHKGAFFLAEELGLDIVPVYIYGTSGFLHKSNFWGRRNDLVLKIGERISHDNPDFGIGFKARTKGIQRHFRSVYAAVKEEARTPYFLRRDLLNNYTYKGTILEWYIRVKIRLEDHYMPIHEKIKRDAVITDLGCGYGMLAFALFYSGAGRKIHGVDYDADKIRIAKHCKDVGPNLSFEVADVASYIPPQSDVFILYDVLHYLVPAQQKRVLDTCFSQLQAGGKIIIRDGDADLKDQLKGTKLTEFFSTRSGFNKTKNNLHFLSGSWLRSWALENDMTYDRTTPPKLTSNVLWVLEKRVK